MNKFRILLLVFIVLPFMPNSIYGQFTLTIEINGLKNNEGQVLLELNNEKGEKISGAFQNIMYGKSIIVFKNQKPGKYAFKYFHDKNKNEKLDTNWLGIPKEGFGFSNNAEGTFGPPAFEKTIFEVKENTTLKCSPKYY